VGQHQQQSAKVDTQSNTPVGSENASSHAPSNQNNNYMTPGVSLQPLTGAPWNQTQAPFELSNKLIQVTRWGLIIGSGFVGGVLFTMLLLS